MRYKGESPENTLWRDPVSEIDQRVETLIRGRVAERFPGHDVIGEEMIERPGRPHDCVWTVDPIDGTTNFVNGFPMFAASIGVLRRGRPLWGPCGARPVTRCGRASITPERVANFALRTTM
ncbi:MAG TPA: inositol monophosphatase family protein [Pseudolabrys sp.]|nr:inositol monophosphatase family protein [Pseudolabrys sp.]